MEGGQPKIKTGHKLRVFLDEKTQEVHIEGNKAGLEYLIDRCKAVIDQPPGPNHWHLADSFNNLETGPLSLIVCFQEQPGPKQSA